MSLSGNEAIREFMDKITSATGVSKYVNLPMIAVMGDTSSGKSSLLSSISMVELPSSSELTTRCPITLQMRRTTEEQAAEVSIVWHDAQDKSAHFEPRIVAKENWAKLSGEIEAAQSHIIKVTGKEVALDKVNVKLSGPDCEDLTLIDLPGIVRSRGDGEGMTIVEDINALMDDYLRNERCVILAVVPANVDFHNSQIMADAKKVDPDTSRTIPVITKPDLIDKGGEGDVKRLLLGQKVRFMHGFHMVKGRGQLDLDHGESIEGALQTEKHFFENADPWRDVSDKSRFGTANLRRKLGTLQMEMFRREVPSIMNEIKTKRDDARTSLEAMGEPILTARDRRMFYQFLVQDMVAGLQDALNESPTFDDPTMVAEIHVACEEFKLKIENGRLASLSKKKLVAGDEVRVATKTDEVKGSVAHVTEDLIFVDYEDRQSLRRGEFIAHYRYAKNHGKPAGDVWTEANRVYIARSSSLCDELRGIPKSLVERDPKWIVTLIRNHRTEELPIFPSSVVFDKIVVQFIDEDWKPACLDLVEAVSDVKQRAMLDTLDRVTTSSRYPRLHERLRHLLDDIDSDSRKDLKKRVEGYIDRNKFSYSQNEDMFASIAKLQTSHLKEQLRIALGLDTLPSDSSTTVSAQSTAVDAVFEMTEQRSLDDCMATYMLHGLDAYGVVLKNRFIDEVPTICWKIIRETGMAMNLALCEATDEDLDRLMKVCPDHERTFREKEDELKQLSSSLDIFKSLM